MRDSELFQKFFTAKLPLATIHAEQLHHGKQILLGGEFGKDAGLLRQVAHAPFPRASVHGPLSDVLFIEKDLALVRLNHATCHPK